MRGVGSDRRVYFLPVRLLKRVRQYQEANGMLSEAEAVRALLNEALAAKDAESNKRAANNAD